LTAERGGGMMPQEVGQRWGSHPALVGGHEG